MRIVLPLATVGGRGGAGFAPTLRIQSLAWQAREYVQIGYTPVIWKTPEYTTDTSSNLVGYSPGKMIGVRATDNHQPPDFNCGEGNWETGSLVTRLKFVTTDGTEIWFHDKLYGGQIQTYTWCSNSNYVVNRKRVFVTSNGEAMTFVSDTDITDVIGPTLEFAPSGYLFMRDGARYRIVNGEVITIRDRNGNYIERNPNNSGQYLTH